MRHHFINRSDSHSSRFCPAVRCRRFPALAFCGLLLCSLAGCAQNYRLTNQTFVKELGDDVFANPSLYIDNPEDVNLSRLSIETLSPGVTIKDNRYVSVTLDYLGVGEYDFVMKDGVRQTPFVLKVKDTQPPVLKNSVDTLTVDLGSTIDWQNVLGATDLSGVYYDAPTDITSSAGEKDITVRIRDRFGNATAKQIRVTVNG